MLEEAELLLEHGTDGIAFGFLKADRTVDAEKTKKMVELIHVKGKKYDKSYLKYEDIRDGVKLRFVMSSKPNYKRAVSDEAVAPSLSLPGKTMKYQVNLMKTGISNQ